MGNTLIRRMIKILLMNIQGGISISRQYDIYHYYDSLHDFSFHITTIQMSQNGLIPYPHV